MKRIVVTAAALMLGTSALAWAPAEKAHLDAADTAKVETAKAAWAGPKGLATLGKSHSNAAVWTEAASSMAKAVDSSAKLESAALDMSKDVAGAATVQTAAWSAGKDGAKVETASWSDVKEVTLASAAKEEVYSGMGGPEVTAEGYPPCDPGPGDDRCIQLYERGVAQAAAAWKGTESVGMGGPYEPAAAEGKEHADHAPAMTHGGSGTHTGHDSADATPSDDAAGTKPPATDGDKDEAIAAGPTPGAIGGPYIARTDYPPCRPGPGDDRCIQLYERGVADRQ